MTEFVLSNNYFEFSEKVFEQISRTAIDTKFAPICKIKIRLAPDADTVLMYFFFNSFWSLGPIIGTHVKFLMFLVFLGLFWSLFFWFIDFS